MFAAQNLAAPGGVPIVAERSVPAPGRVPECVRRPLLVRRLYAAGLHPGAAGRRPGDVVARTPELQTTESLKLTWKEFSIALLRADLIALLRCRPYLTRLMPVWHSTPVLTNRPAVLIIYLPVGSSEPTLDFMQSG